MTLREQALIEVMLLLVESLILRGSGNNRLRYQKGGEILEQNPPLPSERLS
jgi:hypothetical protein